MGKEYINGQMEEYIKENGCKIICMVKDCIYGLMVENTKDNINMIRKMAMVFSNVVMEPYIRVNGKMVNKMGMEYKYQKTVHKEKEYGKKVV